MTYLVGFDLRAIYSIWIIDILYLTQRAIRYKWTSLCETNYTNIGIKKTAKTKQSWNINVYVSSISI